MIEVKDNSFVIDGHPSVLYSGEIHYYRIDPEDWRDRLQKLRDVHANMVATYVPWAFHEPAEGTFDFQGKTHPRRNLVRFLELCGEMKMNVLIRPGPYIYTEMYKCGLPAWLLENYPEVLALNHSGKPICLDTVSYLHPVFLKYANRWYEEVCAILKPFQQSAGGPISFFQIDNELMGLQVWRSSYDYHHQVWGKQGEMGLYARLLEQKYGDIANLNAFYNSDHASFQDITPPPLMPPATVSDWRRLQDWTDFYVDYLTLYVSALRETASKAGIDAGFMLNAANHNHHPLFVEIKKRFPEILIGVDYYWGLDGSVNWHPMTPNIQVLTRFCLYGLKTLSDLNQGPAFVAELQCGSPSDFPKVYPHDIDFFYRNLFLYGCKGLNLYVFAGGDNPEGLGQYQDDYTYQAPVRPDGSLRQTYNTSKSIGRDLFETKPDWATATRSSQLAVGYSFAYAPQRAVMKGTGMLGIDPASLFSSEYLSGLLHTLYMSNINYHLINTADSSSYPKAKSVPLWVYGFSFMPREEQEYIVNWVQQGGQLVLSRFVPVYDENLETCTILKDALVDSICTSAPDSPISDFVTGSVMGWLSNPVSLFPEIRSNAEPIAIERRTGKCIGFRVPVGSGTAHVLGFGWMHRLDTQWQTMREFLRSIGCVNPTTSSDPNIYTTVVRDGSEEWLYASNPWEIEYETDFEWDGAFVLKRVVPPKSVIPVCSRPGSEAGILM